MHYGKSTLHHCCDIGYIMGNRLSGLQCRRYHTHSVGYCCYSYNFQVNSGKKSYITIEFYMFPLIFTCSSLIQREFCKKCSYYRKETTHCFFHSPFHFKSGFSTQTIEFHKTNLRHSFQLITSPICESCNSLRELCK